MNSITLNRGTCTMPIEDMEAGTIFLLGDCIYMRLDKRDPIDNKIACASLQSGRLFWVRGNIERKVFKGDLCLTTGV